MQVLREQLNCTLPVEVAWHTKEEMDNATLTALDKQFGPVYGLNLSAIPFPDHHRR